jgi:hypothetical protein
MNKFQTIQTREIISKKEVLTILLDFRKKIDILSAYIIDTTYDRLDREEINNIICNFFSHG